VLKQSESVRPCSSSLAMRKPALDTDLDKQCITHIVLVCVGNFRISAINHKEKRKVRLYSDINDGTI
jgi:hypothetical protein